MIFSELYSAYYNTVARLVEQILQGNATNDVVHKTICDNAFEESVVSILHAIREERWQVITKDYRTPLKHVPTMPLTTLQRRWLKSILGDKRIRLFDVHVDGLDDVEPLFCDDYRIYDSCSDGDNYDDPEYVARFRLILHALYNKLPLKAEMVNRNGKPVFVVFVPQRIEYSAKDDKFRVITSGPRYAATLNVGRITRCRLYNGSLNTSVATHQPRRVVVKLLVKDERNALERTMLHFAHFEKQVERVNEDTYRLAIWYDSEDQSEMVVRVLSFGPLVEVVEPTEFRQQIVQRLKKQLSCGLK
ncbi:MAG: WYL domain-containing protein [Clostridia bacterium]|nr:WYL domain-containing protein [Clostridia bacterium]